MRPLSVALLVSAVMGSANTENAEDAGNRIHLINLQQMNHQSNPSVPDGNNVSEYWFQSLVDYSTNGKVFLMKNNTGDPQQWTPVGQLQTEEFHGGKPVPVKYTGTLDNDCFYCLKMDTPDGKEHYSSPYKMDWGEFQRQEGLEYAQENQVFGDDDNRQNRRNKNSAVAPVSGFAALVGIATLLML